MTPLTLTLLDIAGVSPRNVRHGETADAEIPALAASILATGGPVQRLVVEPDPQGLGYLVIAGRRRWLALEHLREQGLWSSHAIFDGLLFEEGGTQAASLSLSENVMRRALHPVEEYEAFAALADRGLEPEQIARDFGCSIRHAKQRLALGRLAPVVRDKWKAGEIDAELAQAFAEGSLADQEAAAAEMFKAERFYWNRHDVRRRLRKTAIRGDDARALYVGSDAYAAAGGALRDSLFEEETWFEDGALLERLAEEKLTAEAERIRAAEGWGWALVALSGETHVLDFEDMGACEQTPEEDERIAQINTELAKPDLPQARAAELNVELTTICGRGFCRALRADERAKLGILVDLTADGLVDVDRGLMRADDAPADSVEGSEADPAPVTVRNAEDEPDAPAPPPSKTPPKAAQDVLADALDAALADCAVVNVRFALALVLAGIASSRGSRAAGVAIHGTAHAGGNAPGLLGAVLHESFPTALRCAADAPLADLMAALARTVALTIRTGPETVLADRRAVVEAAAMTGCDIRGALLRHFDAERWFKAMPKEAAAQALREIDGESAAIEAARAKKPAAAQSAAVSARARQWLPPDLAHGLPPAAPVPTLAQAMGAALAADGETQAQDEDRDGDDGQDDKWAEEGVTMLHRFIEQHCEKREGARLKASAFHAAFSGFLAQRRSWTVLPNLHAFAAAAEALDLPKHRYTNGVHYLGLALKETHAEAAP